MKSLHYHSSSLSASTVIISQTFSLSLDVFPFNMHLSQLVSLCFTHPVKSLFVLISTTLFGCHSFFQNMFVFITLFPVSLFVA